MSRFPNLAIALTALLLCVGCTAAGKIENNATYDPTEAYLLIGVEPGTTEVAIVDGEVENGVFSASSTVRFQGGSAWTYFDPPRDGFIFAKAPKGRTVLGTILVRQNGMGSRLYSPCNFRPNLIVDVFHMRDAVDGSIVFHVEPGKVLYITTVKYAVGTDGIMHGEFRTDIEAARNFLKTHYPQFADKLAQGSYQLLPAQACGLNP